jgi:hypothetical protein
MFPEFYLINKINNFINNNNLKNNKEHYIVEHFIDYNKYIYSFLWFCVNCIAAYLSWSCNENKNLNIGFRIFFAIIAYSFGIIYIIVNWFFFKGCKTQN